MGWTLDRRAEERGRVKGGWGREEPYVLKQEVEKEGREGERQERGELEAELRSLVERRLKREGRVKNGVRKGKWQDLSSCETRIEEGRRQQGK